MNVTAFYHGDHIGSARVVTSAGGWPISTDDFYPFGLEQVPPPDPNHYKFTGKERDTESGNDYFGARYYASSMGRFLSPDPITVTPARMVNPQELNLYSYVRNNPLVLTDPTGMVINTDDLNDKDKKLWQKVVDLANEQDANGNYVNPTLHGAYAALDSDSRTFRIEDNAGLGSGTAGQFEITKFNGPNDFSEAKVNLNFGVIKGISSTTQGDFDPSFQKYAGLFGKNGFIDRLAETFGHEASHGVFAIDDPAQGSNIQRLLNARDAAMSALPMNGRYPLPPDVMQKMDAANKALVPTERFAQQQEKIINGELRANPQ